MSNYNNEGLGKLRGVLKLSFIYKGFNVLISFLLIRYTIQYAGDEVYGIWVTILSFLTWFSAIESGISNSFRNQLTSYYSERKFNTIKKIIATAFKSMSIVYLTAIVVLLVVVFTTPFYSFFTTENITNTRTPLLLSIVAYFLYFIFFYLNNILLATHNAEKTYLFLLIQNTIVLLTIVVLNAASIQSSLLLICMIYTLVPLLCWTIFNIFSFSGFLKKIRPSITHFKAAKNPLKKLNPSFFIIQLFTLVIYSTDNIIILNYLNGVEVAKYNVAFKYYNILIVLFNLVLVPYWAIFSEANYKKDVNSIKYSIYRLVKNWLAVLLVAIAITLFSPFAYKLWIGKEMNIPMSLSILMGISALLTAWYSIFSFFLKSANQLRLQRNLLTLAGVLNIPLSLFLINYFNSSGVIIATIFSILPLAIGLPWHYQLTLKRLNS